MTKKANINKIVHSTKRIPYFDMLKGVAIILVIGNHSFSNIPLGESFGGDMMILLRQIIACAVPLFISISGYFMASKSFNNKKEYWSFFIRHSWAIYLPMIIWSIPLFLLDIRDGGVFGKFLQMIFGGYSVYYFIPLIIQFYALQPLLKKVNMGGVIISISITLIAVWVMSYLRLEGCNFKLILIQGLFPYWLIFSALGFYHRKNNSGNTFLLWIVFALASLVLCWLELHYMQNYYGMMIFDSKVSSVLFISCLIPILFKDKLIVGYDKANNMGFLKKGLEWLGINSLGIYFVHCYPLRILINHFDIQNFFLRVSITLVISVSIVWVCKKITPKMSKAFLGFR